MIFCKAVMTATCQGNLAPGDYQISGADFDPEGNLWIADEFSSRLVVFSPDGQVRAIHGVRGKGAEEWYYPRTLRWVQEGEEDFLYACDAWNHRVKKLDRRGKVVWIFGSYGTGEEELSEPCDLAWVAGEGIWIVDRGNHRLVLVNPEGRWLDHLGREEILAPVTERPRRRNRQAGFYYPQAIGGNQGRLWVADAGNQRMVLLREERVEACFPLGPRDVSCLEAGAEYALVVDRARGEIAWYHASGVRGPSVPLPEVGRLVSRPAPEKMRLVTGRGWREWILPDFVPAAGEGWQADEIDRAVSFWCFTARTGGGAPADLGAVSPARRVQLVTGLVAREGRASGAGLARETGDGVWTSLREEVVRALALPPVPAVLPAGREEGRIENWEKLFRGLLEEEQRLRELIALGRQARLWAFLRRNPEGSREAGGRSAEPAEGADPTPAWEARCRPGEGTGIPVLSDLFRSERHFVASRLVENYQRYRRARRLWRQAERYARGAAAATR